MAADSSAQTVLLGARGMLGRQWASALAGAIESGRATGLDLPECDISDAAAVEGAIGPGCELVINCAAYTAVDKAEEEEELATAINGDAVGVVAARCAEVGATLLHYSTDYVFSGDATAPYPVDAPRRPIGAYGRSKAHGEELLEASGADFLMLRSSWLYAAHGANFVRTILRLAGERDTIRVVDDQRGRPTSVPRLVETSRRLLDAGARGTFHATDAGDCTWFEFAGAAVGFAGLSCEVEPCTSEEFPRPAPRPAYSVLDIVETERVAGTLTHWRDALESVVRTIQTAGGESTRYGE